MEGKPRHLGQEELAVEQVGELHQPLLHRLSAALLHVQVPAQGRHPVAGEEDALGVHLVIQEGDPRSHQVTRHVHHLSHEVCRGERQGVKPMVLSQAW